MDFYIVVIGIGTGRFLGKTGKILIKVPEFDLPIFLDRQTDQAIVPGQVLLFFVAHGRSKLRAWTKTGLNKANWLSSFHTSPHVGKQKYCFVWIVVLVLDGIVHGGIREAWREIERRNMPRHR